MVGDRCRVVDVPDGDVAGAFEQEGGQEQVIDGRVLGTPVILPVLRRVVPPGRVPLRGGEGAGDLVQGSFSAHPGALPGVPPQNGQHPGCGAIAVRVGYAVAEVVQIPHENDVTPRRRRLREVVAHHGGLALPLLAPRRVGGPRDEVRAKDGKLHPPHVEVGPEVLGHARRARSVPSWGWGPVTRRTSHGEGGASLGALQGPVRVHAGEEPDVLARVRVLALDEERRVLPFVGRPPGHRRRPGVQELGEGAEVQAVLHLLHREDVCV